MSRSATQSKYEEGKESQQLESVRDFFDEHANEYKQKYQKEDIFYSYFFYERLQKATRGLDFKGKTVLDIGAGTGPLYDYLLSKGYNNFSKYVATDISPGMMNKSNIPKDNQLVGDLLDLEIEDRFDLIFMLGVSTYLKKEKMRQYLSNIKEYLKEGGLLIVTFTNNRALDIIIRKLTIPVARLFAGKNRVLSQSFESTYYSRKEIKKMISTNFEIIRLDGLNHTIFPFSRIVPGISVKLAKSISDFDEGKLKHALSSDLLLIARNR